MERNACSNPFCVTTKGPNRGKPKIADKGPFCEKCYQRQVKESQFKKKPHGDKDGGCWFFGNSKGLSGLSEWEYT